MHHGSKKTHGDDILPLKMQYIVDRNEAAEDAVERKQN